MPWLNIVLFLYAMLDIGMGYMGFRHNPPSVISLIAGTACGLVVLVSILWARTNPRAARIAALLVCVLMMGKFGPKAFGNELYPSGMMFFSSLAVAVCLGVGHMMGMKARKAREAAAADQAPSKK